MRKSKIVVVGSINLDMVATVPRNPGPGETLTGSDFALVPGGKGANQAVAAAMLGRDLRVQVQMIARHGTDGFEARLLEVLRAKSVDISRITPADGPSGIAVILVAASGENSIVVIPGANGRLCAADIQDNREAIEQAGIVLTQLETSLEALLETLKIAGAAGTPVMLDPAPVCELPKHVFEQVAWLTPNETEAAAITGSPAPQGAGLKQYAERLLALRPEHVLLKLGAQGAYLATRAGIREHIPGYVVQAIDTTAAGDALNGALAAALMAGHDPVEAASFGVAAAALSVTRKGAIPSMASLAEVEEFRKTHGPAGSRAG